MAYAYGHTYRARLLFIPEALKLWRAAATEAVCFTQRRKDAKETKESPLGLCVLASENFLQECATRLKPLEFVSDDDSYAAPHGPQE